MDIHNFLLLTKVAQQEYLENHAVEVNSWFVDDNNYHVLFAAPEFIIELDFDFATGNFYLIRPVESMETRSMNF